MLDLKDLGQPSDFWDYFNQISIIPRQSRYEDQIRNFIKNEAEKYGFEYRNDDIGNIAVSIPAVNQKLKCVLQCHMDMVCEKNEEVIHDFSKDPLKLKIIDIDNEKWVTAVGTTLGADNGVGVCYLLTLMKKIHEKEIKFDSIGLDLLFTVREEYDMGGAKNMDSKLVDGKHLINLDSGEKSITIGCTGGIGFHTRIKKKSIFIDRAELNLLPIRLSIFGLKGGHSGRCNKGQAHAIKILSQILWKINKKYNIHINVIHGGGAANAIPREANSIFYIKDSQFTEIKSNILNIFDEIKKQFDGIESYMNISVNEMSDVSSNEVLPKNIQNKLLDLLYTFPNGPITFHPKVNDLMFTSTNLGKIRTKDDHIKIRWLHRSLSRYYLYDIYDKMIALLNLSCLEKEDKFRGSYPPWEANFNSNLLKIAQETYKELYKEEPKIVIIHGGLEATLLINKIPGVDAIAFGANTEQLHSPDERLEIKSVERTWNFLTRLLRKLDHNY
ncbi:MAG: beta-Ala-His dipeptidase [Promethearchaeota archaeon]|nr:MAG: beta-Ala-His dipeptidase [Candidatus Lokiarchaeota archaeon]